VVLGACQSGLLVLLCLDCGLRLKACWAGENSLELRRCLMILGVPDEVS